LTVIIDIWDISVSWR